MKFLDYLCYGPSGFSNVQMSFECGMILSYLTNRVFVIRNEIPNTHCRSVDVPKARISDLFDIPVPYIREEDTGLYYSKKHTVTKLTDFNFVDSVFYNPHKIDHEDFIDFLNGRNKVIRYRKRHRACDILKVGNEKYDNFSYYSYFFYVNGKYKNKIHKVMKNFKPKKPYLDFVKTVLRELGAFNAIHVRIGDFKQTGYAIKEKRGSHLLSSVKNHFDNTKKIIVCTDSEKSHIFNKLKDNYDCLFIGDYIKTHRKFKYLPFRDDTTVAFLTQHIAGYSSDFIGSFGSTFTGLINRYRGKDDFKYLWPEPKKPLKEKYFDKGRMKIEGSGNYSWNSYPYIVGGQGSWYREWPESFI